MTDCTIKPYIKFYSHTSCGWGKTEGSQVRIDEGQTKTTWCHNLC